MTTAGGARRTATRHVARAVAADPRVVGAFLTGSVLAAADGDVLSPASDVDVVLVVDAGEPPRGPGKSRVDGVLLDVSCLRAADLADVDAVRRTHWLAPSFAGREPLLDPAGRLARVRAAVAPTFAEPADVLARCEDVLRRSGSRLQAVIGAGGPGGACTAERVLSWVFPASLLTQVPLVAALEPPTVRRRYAAAGAVLRRCGHADLAEQLLDDLGCADVGAGDVREALAVVREGLQRVRTPVPREFAFAADLEPDAHPVVLDGTAELLDAGLHREAVFWLVVTAARLQQVSGGPEGWFRDLLAGLTGIGGPEDVLSRARRSLRTADRVGGVGAALVRGR
ncbi:hypothetical protein [Kineococcus sp. SYSU DK006]|uniref:hypothetical protein n=1 Tax=Kineococcus sp. SYSU DK006 TaxID=3383127 RepID=UPI003D7CA43D